MTGRHFRDYHLLLDEQGEQIFSMTDDISERARKLGGSTLRSISDIANNPRLKDNNEAAVAPADMVRSMYFRVDANTLPLNNFQPKVD
jgi:starvation-inducible DNA-binding protein